MIIAAANTVSRASVLAASRLVEHQRQDQADLDDRHRNGQDQGAERLPHPVRDDFGMMHRGDHHADQDRSDNQRREVDG